MHATEMEAAVGKYVVKNFSAIILAAGRSRRLGRPKQLLQYHGKTLLQHAVDIAKQAGIPSVVVVLGSDEELIRRTTDRSGVTVVSNVNWKDGMASSIVCGIDTLKSMEPPADAAVLMVCD